eukprot:3546652-Rhodomonas_salina.2
MQTHSQGSFDSQPTVLRAALAVPPNAMRRRPTPRFAPLLRTPYAICQYRAACSPRIAPYTCQYWAPHSTRVGSQLTHPRARPRTPTAAPHLRRLAAAHQH